MWQLRGSHAVAPQAVAGMWSQGARLGGAKSGLKGPEAFRVLGSNPGIHIVKTQGSYLASGMREGQDSEEQRGEKGVVKHSGFNQGLYIDKTQASYLASGMREGSHGSRTNSPEPMPWHGAAPKPTR